MQKLYFLAVIPPKEICNEITRIKEYIFEHYQSKASLRSPPHITLHMPFKWDEEKEEILTENLNYFSTGQNSFQIILENFGAFPPRVIFISVLKSEFLNALQKNLQSFMKSSFKIFNSNYKEQAFHPHITLAFRDLKKRFFTEAWKEFETKKFYAQFKTDNFALLKHNGKIWQIHKTFKLQ